MGLLLQVATARSVPRPWMPWITSTYFLAHRPLRRDV